MKARVWGVLVGLFLSLGVVSAQSGGWVWQNNGSTLTTSTPNNGSAVTIWNKNASGCTLTLKSGAAGTTVLTVCGTTFTISGNFALGSANCYGWSTDTFLQRAAAGSVGVSPTCGGANSGTFTFAGPTFLRTSDAESLFNSRGGGGGGGTFENIAIGWQAGNALAGTGYANTFLGWRAGVAVNGTNPNGASNTLIGFGSGLTLTTGSFNTMVGAGTGNAQTTQSSVTFVGWHAGSFAKGSNNTFVGTLAGAGHATNATGISNTAFGNDAYKSFTNGQLNTAIGLSALEVATSGSNNNAFGTLALRGLTTGDDNTAVGYSAGIGVATGSRNVFLGFKAGQYETGSDAFYVDNQNRTNTAGDKAGALLYGTFNATPASQTLVANAAFSALVSVSAPAFTFNSTTGKTGTTCTAFTVGGCTTATEPDVAYRQLWQPFVQFDVQAALRPILDRMASLEARLSALESRR